MQRLYTFLLSLNGVWFVMVLEDVKHILWRRRASLRISWKRCYFILFFQDRANTMVYCILSSLMEHLLKRIDSKFNVSLLVSITTDFNTYVQLEPFYILFCN